MEFLLILIIALFVILYRKNTGAITHTVYYYCESEKIMEVPNSSFIPDKPYRLR